MDLLAAEITARTGKDPGEHYRDLTAEFGAPFYERIDAPATPEQKEKLRRLSPDAVKESSLAGEPIVSKLTRAPGNDAPIGGLKVTTRSGWFAARPSGTENVYKIYAESFESEEHLNRIFDEAQGIVDGALDAEVRRMTPAFDQGGRQSGILLHFTSLPSRYGIGDMGPAAFRVDRSPAGRWSGLVAGAAAGRDGVWEFSLSTAVFVRGQLAPDQSGCAGGRWAGLRAGL